MAVYEYKCYKCKKITTKTFPMKNNVDWVFCDHCKKGKAMRIISKSNFKIKGYSEKNGYSKKGD